MKPINTEKKNIGGRANPPFHNSAENDDSLLKEAQLLEQEQKNLIDSSLVEQMYESTLSVYVQAKTEQVEKIENDLERMIDKQQVQLQNLQINKPGMLSMPGKKKAWEDAISKQKNRLHTLHNRLDIVKEIKDGMGIQTTKINELATKSMRFDNKELANDWDMLQQANRLHAALQKKQQQEKQQSIKKGVTLSLSHSLTK